MASTLAIRTLVVFLPIASACRTPGMSADTTLAAIDVGAPAAIEMVHRLNLKEVSGLVTVPEVDGPAANIYAIGDRTKHLVRLTFSHWSAEPLIVKRDLQEIFGSGPSQWEGVAADAAGNVVIMRENPSQLYVMRENGQVIQRLIDLDTSTLTEDDDDNSMGEGLALLRNGHVIYLKEKDPPLLIEYGPEGEAPVGITPETLLKVGDAWPSAAGPGTTFVPLKIWPFGDNTQAVLEDFSDLTVTEDGSVYVLSDESRRIALLEREILPTDNKAKIKIYWDLPRAIDKPEGMAFIGEHPVIGSDRIGGKNFFVLKKLQ